MAGTRSSTRTSGSNSSPAKNGTAAGTKRKQEVETSPKRDRKATKKQTTIEESMGKEEDSEMRDASDGGSDTKQIEESEEKVDEDLIDSDDEKALTTGDDAIATTTDSEKKEDKPDDAAKTNKSSQDKQDDKNDGTAKESTAEDEGAVEESSQRAKQVPSNILEKGVIYFFTRNRVGIEESESVGDLQRTFFVLRPMPTGAKLGDGTLADNSNNRLFALPKKVFPKSHNDRFMAFVEKANTTIKELKESFFGANEYETKTQGSRRTEPVAPVAEGVYAITRTEDRTCHLVYSTTIPSELGEVQEDLGIKDQGSFIMSVKNPERSGPAQAQLPQKPNFPKEFIEEFRGLAWVEVKPKYLDYEYCQILLIGEKMESGVEPTTKDQKHDKETPLEEIEKLEHEDELRVEHLHGPIFALTVCRLEELARVHVEMGLISHLNKLHIHSHRHAARSTQCASCPWVQKVAMVTNVCRAYILKNKIYSTKMSLSVNDENASVIWPIQSFAVSNDFKSPGPAILLLDRANSEFGLIYETEPGVNVMAQFPDTGDAIYFQVFKVRAACTRFNNTCKKVCILMQHFQLDLHFTTGAHAADFIQKLARAATKVRNIHFEVHEAVSKAAIERPNFNMEKEGYADRINQQWMEIPNETISEWAWLCTRSQYFNAVCDGQFSETEERSITLPESHQTVSTMLQEIYEVYNSTTGSIFTSFALLHEMEKEHVIRDLLALFVASDKYDLEPIKQKVSEAIVDRMTFIHDPLSIVDLAACIYDAAFPQIDRGLRKAIIAHVQTRLPSIMDDEAAWEDYSGNKAVLKALHIHQCEMIDGPAFGVLTPLASPAKK
ncbi:hypothetical protein CFE70_000887 [Pyrenophora teres f. teres 0-1]